MLPSFTLASPRSFTHRGKTRTRNNQHVHTAHEASYRKLSATCLRNAQTDIHKYTRPAFDDSSAPIASVLNLERPDNAASRVLTTAELLEQILLYLPTQDLINISGVNPVLLNCIRRSPEAQARLFLRPSGEPRQTWYKSEDQGQDDYKETVELTRNIGPDGKCWDSPLSITKLCPLLRSMNRLCGPSRGLHPPSERPVVIDATVSELERFGDMLLTDPPSYYARYTLVYKHMLRPTTWVSVEQFLSSSSPLTIRKLVEGAFREPRYTTVKHVNPDDFVGFEASPFYRCRSLDEVIAEEHGLRGGRFTLVPSSCMIEFEDLTLASTEYCAYIEEKRAELEQKASKPKND